MTKTTTKTAQALAAVVANPNSTAADLLAKLKNTDGQNLQGTLRSLLRQQKVVKLKKDGSVTWKAAKPAKALKAKRQPRKAA